MIRRAFKIGNIVGTLILVLFIGKSLAGCVDMASSNSQEEYIHTLRQIKETEEKTHGEIEAHKKQVEQEIKNLQRRPEKYYRYDKTRRGKNGGKKH